MPSYESVLVIKKMATPELAKVVKRAAVHIFNSNGILFGIEHLGTRQLPHKMSNKSRGGRFKEGSYILMKYDASIDAVHEISDEFRRDLDVIRSSFTTLHSKRWEFECTLDAELQPPSYREEVKKMIEEGRKKPMFVFDARTGLDYNPFRT